MAKRKLFGYKPNPKATKQILEDPLTVVRPWTDGDSKELGVSQIGIGLEDNKESIILLDAVLALNKGWTRGAQGIGDCVSWGWELAAYVSICVDIIYRGAGWEYPGEVATEPIYGGSRVEAQGKTRGGYQDGSFGSAAAKWVTKFGVLHRINYSLTTAIKEHDLRNYSADKAKDWGNFGCGGDEGADFLDKIAVERPVKEAPMVTSWEQLVACIKNGYPVAVCSNQGLSERDNEGFANAQGTWYHCMEIGGLRYGKRPGGLITNSWGNSWGTKKPLPGTNSDAIKKCSAWVDARTIDRMLKQNDSYAVTGVDGLIRREIDWSKVWHVTGRS